MGCDIHGFVEVKKHVNGESKWISADYFKKNEYYNGGIHESPYELVKAFGDRNYTAFAQLCGVRSNGRNVTPISEPRGIPDDVCDLVKCELNMWESDGHSPSYVTLLDVINYRKNLPLTTYTGMISAEQAKNLDDGVIPETWCGWTNQTGYVERTWVVAVDPLAKLESVLRDRLYEFLWVYNEEQVIEQAENIRFVFWFDN